MENRVFLAGKVSGFSGTEFTLSNKNLNIRVFITKELSDYIEKVSQKFNPNDELYVVVHGFLATLQEYTYVFPYNVVFSKEPQKEASNVVFSGKLSDVYEYENRYRLFIHSERKGKITKMFATLFKDDFGNLNPKSLIGQSVAVIGRLTSNRDNENASIVVSELYSENTTNSQSVKTEEVQDLDFSEDPLDSDELMF